MKQKTEGKNLSSFDKGDYFFKNLWPEEKPISSSGFVVPEAKM